jgi:DNA-binding transcriptional MerR regulator
MQKIPSGYIGIRELSARSNASQSRIRRWLRKGLLPHVKYGDYRFLFRENELANLISIINRLLGREK